MDQFDEIASRLAAALARTDTAVQGVADRPEVVAPAAEDTVPQHAMDAVMAQLAETEKLLAQAQAELSIVQKKLIDAQAMAQQATNETVSAKAALESALDEAAVLQELVDEAAKLEPQHTAIDRLDLSVQQVQDANQGLRDANAALRAVQETALPDPDAITKSLHAEISGLKAARVADAATAGAILSRLEPLLTHASDLPEGEEE
jgi:chromosome segregation ATPase